MAEALANDFLSQMGAIDTDQVVNDNMSSPNPVFDSLFAQYEQVVLKSLITSFGLDLFLGKDQRGGDVDTIHTVRDETVGYKDQRNAYAYEHRGDYDSKTYHTHPAYIEKNRQVSEEKKNGTLIDSYSGQRLAPNASVDLDHTISAKDIHDDRGRVLAGIAGEELANRDTNLNATSSSINRSKKAKSADVFINDLDKTRTQRQNEIQELKSKNSLTDEERKRLNKLEQLESVDRDKLKEKDRVAREAYEREIAQKYYTSPKFLKATARACLNQGARMGARQALGFVFAEVWFSLREDMPEIVQKMKGDFQLDVFLKETGQAVKRAFDKVREQFKEVLETGFGGALSGVLSSISSTLMNIFFTTAKRVGKILRESWASIVEAVRLLVFNPDDLAPGDLILAVSKIIAASVSVICGGLVQEAVGSIVKIPMAGDIVAVFAGSMVTGIMTVSILYFLDHSKQVRKLVNYANSLEDTISKTLDYYINVNRLLNKYATELESLDIQTFEKEVNAVQMASQRLKTAQTPSDLQNILLALYDELGIKKPWKGDFNDHMADRNARLIFE